MLKFLVVGVALPILWAAPLPRAGSAPAAEPCPALGDGGGNQVAVSLSEFRVDPSPATVPAGPTTFTTLNDAYEVHELVVAKGDRPDGLPVTDGLVDTAALGPGAVIGEIAGIQPNSVCSATFHLPAGAYVLFCNIVERKPDGRFDSHYEEGMRAGFTVTAAPEAPRAAAAAHDIGVPGTLPRTGPSPALLLTAGGTLTLGGLAVAAGRPRRRAVSSRA